MATCRPNDPHPVARPHLEAGRPAFLLWRSGASGAPPALVLGLILGLAIALMERSPTLAALPPLPWRDGPGFRVAPLTIPDGARTGFVQLDPGTTGVGFANQLSDHALATNQLLEVGSGVALGDMDGDGFTDLYFCSLGGTNRLYRNLGHWRFEDTTDPAGVGCAGQFSTGAVFADVDADGDRDLLVNAIGRGTRLFRNDGSGRFREDPNAGLESGRGSTSMALADIDGDGTLDLYVANYHTRTVKDAPGPLEIEAGMVDGKFVINPPGVFLPIFLRSGGVSLFERGEPDVLYRNNGRGVFTPLSWTNGTFVDPTGQPLPEAPKDWGLTAAFRDLNNDGAPDLYVCNDFFHSPDHLWINDGKGRFRAVPPFTLRHTSMSSMALDFADLDRDGHEDFLVLDMLSRDHALRQRQRASMIHLQAASPIRHPAFRPEYPRNTLFWNRGDGTYSEIAQASGVEASEWSWSIAFLDVDLDGYEDALIVNGTARDANQADVAKMDSGRLDGRGAARGKNLRFPPSITANLAFRNRGNLTFQECGEAWGFNTLGISHGLALGDLDNDGDLDVVVNHLRQPAGLYRCDTSAPRVAVRTVGQTPNLQGVGAKLELQGGAVPRQSQQMTCGGRYLSGDDSIRVFAAGTNPAGMTLKVTWRSGASTLIEDVRANHLYEVHESPAQPSAPTVASQTAPPPAPAPTTRDPLPHPVAPPGPLFADVSSRLRQPHQEADYNDLERQPTLARGLSRRGPGVAWRDLDQDGWEDLIVGGGKGYYGVVHLNRGGETFQPTRRRDPLHRDQTTVLTLTSPQDSLELLAGASNYEDETSQASAVVAYDLQQGKESAVVGPQPWSVGPLALGLIGRRQALFVGARVLPGHYPEPVGSQLYVRDQDTWRLDPKSSAALARTGLASGATWADLNGDGELELAVACEWGPLRLYQVREGALQEVTEPYQLHPYVGWWNGVAAGDFDEDGRMDLLASNWGRNTRYERHRSKPIRLYHGDWLEIGQVETIEAYFEPTRQRYVPFTPLDALRASVPGLADRFPTFAAYAEASVEEVIGLGDQPVAYLEAGWFETTLFLNRGDHFEAQPLPFEAQLAPAFGVSIADVDGDGHEDAFLSQNFFDVEAETSRYDAGRGLLLLGDGRGGLRPVPAPRSGILLHGEQRGSAYGDFDRDGRPDLAVGQNGGPTALFRNVGGRPGLRLRLRGPTWNRDGIGATLRLQFGDTLGPARCVQLGSGYWSQESPVQIMTGPSPPTAVHVRWPGGATTRKPLSPTDREIVLEPDTP